MRSPASNFIYGIRANLYPSSPEEMNSWVVRHIGVPEFGWDYETLYHGLCPPLHDYLASLPEFFSTALCIRLIEENDLDINNWVPLVETSERLTLAAVAYEDLIFKTQSSPPQSVSLTSRYGDTVAGILTASMLATSCNKLLFENPLGWTEQLTVEMFDQCARAGVALHYSLGMQRSWTQDTSRRPSFTQVLFYAAQGPIGYANALSFMLTSLALDTPKSKQVNLGEAMHHLNIAFTILNDLSIFNGPEHLKQDFCRGMYTPLNLLCADYLDIPISELPSFRQMAASEVLGRAIKVIRAEAHEALHHVERLLAEEEKCAAARVLVSEARRVAALLD